MKRHFVTPAAVVTFVLTAVGPAWADGYEFFTVDRGREVNLVYVGQIREKGSGKMVRVPAYFMVTEKRSGMTFPFVNDRPGHYRSPDIGESVEELAGTRVNPKDLQFELVIEGYKNVTVTDVPRKSKGVVEVNFRVERNDGNAVAGAAQRPSQEDTSASRSANASSSAGAPRGEGPAGGSGSRSIRLLLIGLAATIIAGAGARTLVLRQSTTR